MKCHHGKCDGQIDVFCSRPLGQNTISQPILPAAEPGNVILQPSVAAMPGAAPEEEGNEWRRPTTATLCPLDRE